MSTILGSELSRGVHDQEQWPEVAFDAAWARSVKDARKLSGMSQGDLASASGVSQGRISQIEKHANGKGVMSSSAVVPICRALAMPLPILGESEPARRWREAGLVLHRRNRRLFEVKLAEVEALIDALHGPSGDTASD